MSSFVSKWVVLQRHVVGADDLDAAGVLRDDVARSASCTVSFVDPANGEPGELGDAVRDELIALAHTAQHFN